MALDPITAAAIKKMAIETVKDPNKVLKNVATFVGVSLFSIASLIILPFVLVSHFSALMIPTLDTKIAEAQSQAVQHYRDAVEPLNQKNLAWIEAEEVRLSNQGAEEVEVRYVFDTTWELLIAIDSVKQGQIFELETIKNLAEAKKSEILALGESLTNRDSRIVTRTRIVNYTVQNTDGTTSAETRTEEYKAGIITVQSLNFDQITDKLGFTEEEKFVASNIYSNLTGSIFDENGNQIDNDLSTYPPGQANVPYYNQSDKRWGNQTYGDGTISQNGCGPTTLAMAVSLTGKIVYPDEMARWATNNGYMAYGAGSYWSLFESGARKWGLNSEPISKHNPTKIVQALSEGKVVAMICGKGYFTVGGHFILLTGVTEDGKIMIHDPWSHKKTQETYDLSFIINNASSKGTNTFWALSSK